MLIEKSTLVSPRLEVRRMLNFICKKINRQGIFYLDYRINKNTVYIVNTCSDSILAMFLFDNEFFCYHFDSDIIGSVIDDDYHVNFLLDVFNAFYIAD